MVNALTPRQHAILQQAKDNGFVMIDAVAAQLGVTTQTIRRDITVLCEEGVLSRFHGGAAFQSSTANIPYEARRGSFQKEKELIASMVVDEIGNGSSVFLDIGTTAEAVARKLRERKELRILTNNLNVVSIFADREDSAITVVCGTLRHRDLAINGEAAAEFVARFHLDFSILGVVALTEEGDILDFSIDEAGLTQAILKCGRRSFVVADHSKFGRPAIVKVAHLDQVDTLFTDSLPAKNWSNLAEIVRLRVAE
jgi:DeoR family glycerol-3-phosphate regulon repressor